MEPPPTVFRLRGGRWSATPRRDAMPYYVLTPDEWDALVKERDAATARAEKAEALLREVAQEYRYEFSDDQVARIDDHLRGSSS